MARKEVAQAAKQAVARYFAFAQRFPKKNAWFSGLGYKTALRYRVSLPTHARWFFSKHSKQLLVPGKNCRVRVHRGKVILTDLTSKTFRRKRLEK